MQSSGCLRTSRKGFTLIELIVVIVILSILSTLVAVYVLPTFQDSKNVVRGVDRITTALLIAKGRALRDQWRGVRFILVPNAQLPFLLGNPPAGSQLVTQLQYIERPDPMTGTLSATINANATNIAFTGVDFIGGADTNDYDLYQVQPNDYLRVEGANYLISTVASKTQLTLAAGHTPPVKITAPTPYQIIRQTRPISGENLINLPDNVVVDLGVVGSVSSGSTGNTSGGIQPVAIVAGNLNVNTGSAFQQLSGSVDMKS